MNVELRIFRAIRNRKLAECDWTILPSSPLSAEKQDEWKVYRQALRDITNTYQSMDDDGFAWPTKPGE